MYKLFKGGTDSRKMEVYTFRLRKLMLTKIQSWIKTFCENSQLGLKPSYSVYASKQDRLKYGCFK